MEDIESGENKRAHLATVQAVITRMGSNSFKIKGWSVVLVSALFALASRDLRQFYIFLAYFPAIVFWGLDGYFLRQERLFRWLYDEVRAKRESEIDFSMNTSGGSGDVDDWWGVTFSPTLRWFHGVVIAAIVLVMLGTMITG